MKFLGFGSASPSAGTLDSGEGDWVIDWLCEGKEERRGKGLTMI